MTTTPHSVLDFLQSEEAITAYLQAAQEGTFASADERAAALADAEAMAAQARALINQSRAD